MELKVWYESKTLWVNVLFVLGAVATFVLDQQHQGLLPFALDPRWVVFVLGMVNIGLRFMTEQPLTLRKG